MQSALAQSFAKISCNFFYITTLIGKHWKGKIDRETLQQYLFSIFHIKSPTSTSWMLLESISPMFCNWTKDSRRPKVSHSQYRTYNLTVVAFSPSSRIELLFHHFASALNLDNKCWSNDQTTAIQGKVTDQVVVLKPKLIHSMMVVLKVPRNLQLFCIFCQKNRLRRQKWLFNVSVTISPLNYIQLWVYRYHICHKHHKQRLCKIIITHVKVHFVDVF